ncbi:MAG: hypothetical protein II837_14075 [Treponema sp.]|nr:hypothetical protein [Treponema sp.]MBQ7166968.1 hypothetical protein [Treponema sp.]
MAKRRSLLDAMGNTINEDNTLLDGHTRYAAAEKVGLFDTFRDDAMFYALGLQLFRRNLTQQQLVFAADRLIDPKECF